jgi:hypothetical protein
MSDSAEKVARNNAVFRGANDEIRNAAAEHGLDDGRPTPFICECSDPRCTQILSLTLAEYGHVRSNPRWFAHAPGHETEVPGIVEPVERKDGYVLVQKVGRAGTVASRLATDGRSD